VPHPAHIEPLDLDRDGAIDLLVADLGSLRPGDHLRGQVVWLRRDPQSATYESRVLARGIGRVADVQPADFDGDGDIDLVVASFGWRRVGCLIYMENKTTDWNEPKFESHLIQQKAGAIHVPIADMNGDGRPDFVALLSQEHEQIIAFLNQGDGQFREQLLFAASDPAYGSTGIQLVDFDQDGDLDVLYTNGDSMDSFILKPYHAIHWLENQGVAPFRAHHVATMPGVHRAIAADFDGDNDLDIAAASFLPNTVFSEQQSLRLSSVIWLENEEFQFLRHVVETEHCDHAAMDVLDCDSDGRPDLVLGNFSSDGLTGPMRLPPMPHVLSIWYNRPSD
jgi:hypothetical protein